MIFQFSDLFKVCFVSTALIMTPCSCEVKTCGCKNVEKINEETRKSKKPTRKRKYKRPVAKPKRKFDKLLFMFRY